MWADDDTLLETLRKALTPAVARPAEPSPRELAALATTVKELCGNSRLAPIGPLARHHRWMPRTFAALAAAAVLGTAGTAAAATGAVGLPRPVRAFAHEIGLPVDSSEMAAVKFELSQLRDATRARDTERMAAIQVQLIDQLDRLPASDRQQEADAVSAAETSAEAETSAADPLAISPAEPDTTLPPIAGESTTAPPSTARVAIDPVASDPTATADPTATTHPTADPSPRAI